MRGAIFDRFYLIDVRMNKISISFASTYKKAIHLAIYITKICKTIEKVCQKPIIEKIFFVRFLCQYLILKLFILHNQINFMDESFYIYCIFYLDLNEIR